MPLKQAWEGASLLQSTVFQLDIAGHYSRALQSPAPGPQLPHSPRGPCLNARLLSLGYVQSKKAHQAMVITVYSLKGHRWSWQSPEQGLATPGSSRTTENNALVGSVGEQPGQWQALIMQVAVPVHTTLGRCGLEAEP